MENVKERAILVLDGNYVKKSIESIEGKTGARRLNYKIFNEYLSSMLNCNIIEKYYYDTVYYTPTKYHDSFLNQLSNCGYIRPKYRDKHKNFYFTCKCCGRVSEIKQTIQTGVDIGLAFKIAYPSSDNTIKFVVLFSGDGDLEEAFIRAENNGVKICLIAHSKRVSDILLKRATKFIKLEDIWKNISYDINK